jgi:hypothetical protein
LEADTEPIADTVTTLEPVRRSSDEEERPTEKQDAVLIKEKLDVAPQARNRKPFENEKVE